MSDEIDMDRIEAVFRGEIPKKQLTDAEHAVWFGLLCEKLGAPSTVEEEAAFRAYINKGKKTG